MEVLALKVAEFIKVRNLFTAVIKNLQENSIGQWDRFYPNSFILFHDLWRGQFFGIKKEKELFGVVVLNTKQSKQYVEVDWEDRNGEVLIVHRLAVHPDHQGKGVGKRLLHFVEEYAKESGFSSVRLDVYSGNPGAVALYRRSGYQERGTVSFPFRKEPYHCFEKKLP